MPNKVISSIFLLTSLFLSITGCTSTVSTQSSTNQGTKVIRDEIIRNESGGFAFQPLNGYELKENAGTATLFLPKGDQQSGPGMVMTGVLLDQPGTLKQAIKVVIKTYTEYAFSEAKTIEIGGTEGVSMDFTTTYHAPDGIILENPGASEGEKIQGKVILVKINPTQKFICVMLAPANQWEEFAPQFDAEINSLEFFTIQP